MNEDKKKALNSDFETCVEFLRKIAEDKIDASAPSGKSIDMSIYDLLPKLIQSEIDKVLSENFIINADDNIYISTRYALLSKFIDGLPDGYENEIRDVQKYKIDKLADQLSVQGIKSPIIVGPEGIEGQHRILAAKIAGLNEIPVIEITEGKPKITPGLVPWNAKKFPLLEKIGNTPRLLFSNDDVLENLEVFTGHAFRADFGLPYGRNTTAYDVVMYEKKLGNENNIPESILSSLKLIPATGIVWVTKNKKDARLYGENIEEVPLDKDSRIVGFDNEGGYLVLMGRYVVK